MVPERRPDLARLGMRSILAGGLATCFTGALAGLVGAAEVAASSRPSTFEWSQSD